MSERNRREANVIALNIHESDKAVGKDRLEDDRANTTRSAVDALSIIKYRPPMETQMSSLRLISPLPNNST